MAWYMEVIKIAGKPAALYLLDQLGGDEAMRLKKMIGGSEEEVKNYLQNIDSQIQELKKLAEKVELRTMFQGYNTASGVLETLSAAYDAHKDKELDDPNRQNACRAVLAENGASYQARQLLTAFHSEQLPHFKSLLQEYSESLLDSIDGGYPDVFSYCARMEAVVEHLRLNLTGAAALRKMCYDDLKSKKYVKDVELTEEDARKLSTHYAGFLGRAREIKNSFEQFAAGGKHARLQHYSSNKYLTSYEKGRASSGDAPFGRYTEGAPDSDRHGMPQVYLYKQARGQAEKYQQTTVRQKQTAEGPEIVIVKDEQIEVKVDGASQDWKVIKLGGDGEPVRFVFQQRQCQKVLDGTQGGRIYISPLDKAKQSTWWQPIPIRKDKELEQGAFLLKHTASRYALDSNEERVYADRRVPDYNNRYMWWRLVQKDINVLGPGEFLSPGEELVSQNQRYALRYRKDGGLELVDTNTKTALWFSGTWDKGAWRCVMQKDDGNFVVYAKENEAVWATNRYGSQFASSRLVLQDDGSFEVVGPDDKTVWRMKTHPMFALRRLFSKAKALYLRIPQRLSRLVKR